MTSRFTKATSTRIRGLDLDPFPWGVEAGGLRSENLQMTPDVPAPFTLISHFLASWRKLLFPRASIFLISEVELQLLAHRAILKMKGHNTLKHSLVHLNCLMAQVLCHYLVCSCDSTFLPNEDRGLEGKDGQGLLSKNTTGIPMNSPAHIYTSRPDWLGRGVFQGRGCRDFLK